MLIISKLECLWLMPELSTHYLPGDSKEDFYLFSEDNFSEFYINLYYIPL